MSSSSEEDDEDGPRIPDEAYAHGHSHPQDSSSEIVRHGEPDLASRVSSREPLQAPSEAADDRWQEVKRVMNRINSRRSRERQNCALRQLQSEKARLRRENEALRSENQQIREILLNIQELKSQVISSPSASSQLASALTVAPLSNITEVPQQDAGRLLHSHSQPAHSQVPRSTNVASQQTGFNSVNSQTTHAVATNMGHLYNASNNQVSLARYQLPIGFQPGFHILPPVADFAQLPPELQIRTDGLVSYTDSMQANQQMALDSLLNQSIGAAQSTHSRQLGSVANQETFLGSSAPSQDTESPTQVGSSMIPQFQPSDGTIGNSRRPSEDTGEAKSEDEEKST